MSRIKDIIIKSIVKKKLRKAMSLDNLDDGMHVVLLGTGSPIPDIGRACMSIAIIAGGYIYIVDAGEGSVRKFYNFGLNPGRIEAVFLTHYHSDHIASLGELMMNRWVGSKHTNPLDVYGPVGIDKVVEGFNLSYELDSIYRNAHHGSDFAPLTGAGGNPITFDLGEKDCDSKIIFEKNELKVTAFNVNHAPVKPAVGYKFEYCGRSVVISGDTVYSKSVLRQAFNVDLLIHEALSVKLVNMLEEYGGYRVSKVAHDIVSYHSSLEDAARLAEKAGVKNLVFVHVIPPITSRWLERYFLKEAKKIYNGRMIVGIDGLMFSMPSNSSEIFLKKLIK